MQHIHRESESLVSLLRNRAVGHSACLEASDDRFNALDLVDRNGIFGVVEVEQTSQADGIHLLVDKLGIQLVERVIALFGRLLEGVDSARIIEMLLRPLRNLWLPRDSSSFVSRSERIKRRGVELIDILFDIL